VDGRWGIDGGYWDAAGQWRDAPESTLDAVRTAMGGEEGHEAQGEGRYGCSESRHHDSPVRRLLL